MSEETGDRDAGHWERAAAFRVFALAVGLAGCAPHPLFEAAVGHPAGSFPVALAVGDIDRDGHADVVTANYSGDTLSILHGDGAGGFSAPETLSTGHLPNSVALGQFDGNPLLDVASADQGGSVTLFLNGSTSASTIPLGGNPSRLLVADVDKDGREDLIVLAQANASLLVLAGNGDGTFKGPTSYSLPSGTIDIAVADIDSDGTDDVVALARTLGLSKATIAILRGRGDGTFAPSTSQVDVGSAADALVIADISGDGVRDLIMTDHQDNTLIVALGVGHGTFDQPRVYDTALGPAALTVADLDGRDGPDIAVATSSALVSVLLNDGRGTLSPRSDTPIRGGGHAITAGDFLERGRADLAIAVGAANEIDVLLANGPALK